MQEFEKEIKVRGSGERANLQKYLQGTCRQAKSWRVRFPAPPLSSISHCLSEKQEGMKLEENMEVQAMQSHLHGDQCTALANHPRGSVL